MAVFDFSQIPANANALAANIQDLERRHVMARRQDEAYNALRSIYGPQAGDPQATVALQGADIASQDAQLRQAADARAAETHGLAMQTGQGQLADAEAERHRTAFLEAGTYIQGQIAQGVDPGVAFDQIAPQLNLSPEDAAAMRAEIVANPGQIDEMVTALGGGPAQELPALTSSLIDAQQGAIVNGMRFAQAAAARGEDPVAAFRSVSGRLGLSAEQVAALEQIAADPARLEEYIKSFGDQDALLARNQELERILREEGQEAYDRALASMRVTTPGQAQAVAAGRAAGTGQGEALLALPQMAANIAQVDGRIEEVLSPEREAEFRALFGLPNFRGLQQGGFGYLGELAGTPAANAAADLEGVMGDISAAAYASLRGGGQITEAERQSVERSYGNLQRSQTWESFQHNLREFQLNLYRIYERQQQMARGNFNDFLLADPTQENWARDLFQVDRAEAGGATPAGQQAPVAITDQAGYDALPAGATYTFNGETFIKGQ